MYIAMFSSVFISWLTIGERGSAPKRGRHSMIFVSTKCICAVTS